MPGRLLNAGSLFGIAVESAKSERLCEAEAQSRKREILMAYPAANVRIEKADESGRAK
jgi:hypothetical protein